MKKEIIVIFVLIIIVIAIGVYFLFPSNWSQESCAEECEHRGYNLGDCLWPTEAGNEYENIGSCLVKNSRHCGNEGQCNCYCYNQQLIGGCGGVAPEHIQECCDRLARENNIITPACVGEWEVREGKCGWKCGTE